MAEEKKCRSCGEIKPLTQFYKNVARPDGLQPQCTECDKARVKLYKQMNQGKTIKGAKQWVKTNKNHYPDSDWVWTQIENSNTGEKLINAMEKKYALKAHGNLRK